MSVEHPLLIRARRDIERVEIQRAKAEASLALLDAELRRLQGFVEQYEVYIGEQERKNSSPRYRMSTREITDIAVFIIEISESPLTIQEVLERLDSRDIEIGGENKSGNLAAYLSKDNRVRYERGFGWMSSTKALFPDEMSRKNVRDGLREAAPNWAGATNDKAGSRARGARGREPVSDIDDGEPF